MLLIYVVERMGRTTKALTQCTGECCGGYQFKQERVYYKHLKDVCRRILYVKWHLNALALSVTSYVHKVEYPMQKYVSCSRMSNCDFACIANRLNPLNPELNPIRYLLALLAHHFLHVSRIRVKSLTLRLLMSYIYMERLFLVFLDHTQ